MSDDLRRQRRNLMLVSMILWFMKYAGVTIGSVRPMGAEISIDDPSAILLVLWIFWGYFLVRYYLYFRQEGAPKMRINYREFLDSFCTRTVLNVVRKKHKYLFDDREFKYRNLRDLNWYTKRMNGIEEIPTVEFQSTRQQGFKMDLPYWRLWRGFARTLYKYLTTRSDSTDYLFPFALALGIVVYYWLWRYILEAIR